jgi:hypothetical protein
MIFTIMILGNITVHAKIKTINETETELCESLEMALMSSNRKPVDKAINEIYKNDKNVPEGGLSWAAGESELLKIKQVYGVGGLYELTLKVSPYYGAHNSYGEDEVVINTDGKLISYKHLKTYK